MAISSACPSSFKFFSSVRQQEYKIRKANKKFVHENEMSILVELIEWTLNLFPMCVQR